MVIAPGPMPGSKAHAIMSARCFTKSIAESFEIWRELVSTGRFVGQGDHHSPKPFVRQASRKDLTYDNFVLGFARAWRANFKHDNFVASFCKRCGECRSRNTRRSVETSAHLMDQSHAISP